MSGAIYPSVPSLAANESIRLDGGAALIGSSSIANVERPIIASFGPLVLCATPAEAIALGDALIRMAHHYTAALAEYQASQGEQAAAKGGVA